MEIDEGENDLVIQEDKDESGDQTKEMKDQNAMKRERFLRTLLAMQKKPAAFNLYENTKVNATFEGSDSAFDKIVVSNLATPIALYDTAILRTSDLLTFSADMGI